MPIRTTIVTAALMLGQAAPGLAQTFEPQIDARQAQFQLMSGNLGILGGMAKGEIAYDADIAAAAAANLVTVGTLRQEAFWPAGSDSFLLDGETRAKPEIWDNFNDFLSKWDGYGTAAAQLQTAVAAGPDGLGAAVGQAAEACKACHESYRAPRN